MPVCDTQEHLPLGIWLGKTEENHFFHTLCFCTASPTSTVLAHTLCCLLVHLSCFYIHWDFVFMEHYGILLYCNEVRLDLVILIICYQDNEQLVINYGATDY